MATVKAMLADAEGDATAPLPADGAADLLGRKGIQSVTFEGWTRIERPRDRTRLVLGKPQDENPTRAALLAAAAE